MVNKMESDSDESLDTTEIEHIILITNEQIEEMLQTLTALEERLEQFHRPLQDLHIEQMGNLDFLAAASLRNETFLFAKPQIAELAGLDPKQRHSFGFICERLRAALFSSSAVSPEGSIKLNKSLRELFEVKGKEITYIGLLAHLRKILV
jgi:transposase